MLKPTRRAVIRATGLLIAAPTIAAMRRPAIAAAEEPSWRHGASLFGDLKYPAGFARFEYVNPAAPKGGLVRLIAIGTFDNFNPVVAGVKGNLASGVDLIRDTLMSAALDEVYSGYGLVAESVSYPPDFANAIYRLRPQARWHDGEPVTPADVVFSFDVFKKNHPQTAAYYRHVIKAEQTGDREVTFSFDAPGNRELPQIIGELTVLPKHYWEGVDGAGNRRDVTATTLEAPLGSGPYRIKDFDPGSTIVYGRVPDYWGSNLAVNAGINNFDELRFDYFRDPSVAFEAFKAGDIDWYDENNAKNWAAGYDFPAMRQMRVVREEFPIRNSGYMQAFAFNIRRAKFTDPRVRRAFNFAFNFEAMNQELFYGQYRRIASYFDGTELACAGMPEGQELQILDTVRDQVPAEVFTTPYWNPVAGTAEAARANLLQAVHLLDDAGYTVRNMKLVDKKTGQPISVEFLLSDEASERYVLFYQPSLERLGIAVSTRIVDDSQYINRLRQWDYEIIIQPWVESLSPGNEQRDSWGSAAADIPGSLNLVGIKNPAIDTLIDRVVYAKNRDELVAATKALDRVLLWNHYMVPQWSYPNARTARWDRLAHPEAMPIYGAAAFPTIWWYDAARSAKIGPAR